MSSWREVARFLYGAEFWYTDPEREVHGLTEGQLCWVPEARSLCALWHVGHIAHRERLHIGRFLQGYEQSDIIPARFEVFGPEWHSADDVLRSVASVESVLEWVRDVRRESLEYITSLEEADFLSAPTASEEGLSVAHWLFVTTAHGALHIGPDTAAAGADGRHAGEGVLGGRVPCVFRRACRARGTPPWAPVPEGPCPSGHPATAWGMSLRQGTLAPWGGGQALCAAAGDDMGDTGRLQFRILLTSPGTSSDRGSPA